MPAYLGPGILHPTRFGAPMTRILLSTIFTGTLALFGAVAFLAAQDTPAALEASARDAEQAGRLKEAFDLYVRAVQALPQPPTPDVAHRRGSSAR